MFLVWLSLICMTVMVASTQKKEQWPDETSCSLAAGFSLEAAVKGNTSQTTFIWTSDVDIADSSAEALVRLGIGPRAVGLTYNGSVSLVPVDSTQNFMLIKLDTDVYFRRRNFLCVNSTSLFVGSCPPLVIKSVLPFGTKHGLIGKKGTIFEWDADPTTGDALLRPVRKNKHPVSVVLSAWIVNQGFNKTCPTLLTEFL